MTNYNELVKELRSGCGLPVLQEKMNNAADAIEELQKRLCGSIPKGDAEIIISELSKPRWISVKERLPKDDERVLTIGPKGGMQICRFRDSTPTLGWHFWTAGNARIATVTHWMPLPDPPKEETE